MTSTKSPTLVELATLVVRARSAVERDSYRREIELVAAPEAPTRLVIALNRLLAGLDAIGVDRPTSWQVVTKAALDSMPALRLAVLRALEAGQLDTNAIATIVRHPATTTRRALEDLTAHGLVEQERQGEGLPHLWILSAFAAQGLRTFPENPPPTYVDELKRQSGVSGTPHLNGQIALGDPGKAAQLEAAFAAGHITDEELAEQLALDALVARSRGEAAA